MKIAVRVDGNAEIGIGHVLRCITLADKLLNYNIKCTFFVRNISKNLSEILDAKFEVILLDRIDSMFNATDEYSRWLGVNQRFDAEEFITLALPGQFNGVVVDHYGLGYQWERTVQDKFRFVLVLDDLANREHICNLLVDQSIGRNAACYSSLVPQICTLLVGPKYALLRDEFSADFSVCKKQYDILINFGGSDKDNYTEHVLGMLTTCANMHKHSIKIIIGSDYPYTLGLERRIEELGLKFKLVENPNNVAREISECSIAIGAGGVSLLERSALGVPSIIYAIADNQEHICAEYERQGLGVVIRKGEIDEHIKLASIIDTKLDPKILSKESHLNRNFVDAHGTDRVVAKLLKEFDLLTEAEATIEDTKFVYECRYEKTDTSLYVNSNIPTYECHMNWFSKNLVQKDCIHIIFQCGLAKIGYIRLDRKKNFYDVSIYVHTKYRSRGFAEIMLNKIVDRFGTQKLQASVHVKNEASLKVFLNCAFNIISKDQNFVRLEYC